MTRGRFADTTPLTDAQARLVAAHAGWASAGAQKRLPKYASLLTFDDLQSAAHMGLMQAARRFDPARGCTFKTYAMPWCESLMRREFDEARRAKGGVWDPRVEGNLRFDIHIGEWPTDEDGRALEIGCSDPHDAFARRHARAVVLDHASKNDRRFVRQALTGDTTAEVARALGVSPNAVNQRLAGVARRIARRMEAARQQRAESAA